MLNFPVPYPDELLYSTVARAGVHFGIISPKQLLDEAFGDRKVIATVDLPSNIQALSEHYPKSLRLTTEELIYKHTQFPLYAPFVPEDRRLKCLERMKACTKGAVHLALGVTTSLILRKRHFRVCPECMDEQLKRYGEYFWARQWQVAGCHYCSKHAELSSTKHLLRNDHRHGFIALAPTTICQHSRESRPYDKRIESRVSELLDLPATHSPKLEQWSQLYWELALAARLTRGSKVIFQKLKRKVLSRWSQEKLRELGIPIDDRPTNWLRLFMRKHRKAFSYLQHIVMLDSLQKPNWTFLDVLSQAHEQKNKPIPAPTPRKPCTMETLHTKRANWEVAVKMLGTRKARLSGWDHIYTWLYRNDRSWLTAINKKHRRSTSSTSLRVNWHERDKQILKGLEAIQRDHLCKVDSPRRSKNWYLAQVGYRHMFRKLEKLPLTSSFLEKNSEGVASYQIRRLTNTMRAFEERRSPLKYWELLYSSGISEARMRKRTRYFLRQKGWPA